MKFYKIFFIFSVSMLLTHFVFAGPNQVVIRYSGIWPNTLNVRWDVADSGPSYWMQFYAIAEKQPDGSSRCAVYCKGSTILQMSDVSFISEITCNLFSFVASSIGNFSAELRDEKTNANNFYKLYNQITQCSVQNGQVVWPIYDEVYQIYQSTKQDKVVKISDESQKEPVKMNPIAPKK